MLGRLSARVRDANIFRVYAVTLGLGIAYGIAISVIALHLDRRGFGKAAIGELAAWFAAGIVACSIPAGHFVRRFSAKRTLVCALLGYAFTVSLLPFVDSYRSLAILRFFDGAASVCVWVASETILLARAEREQKAFVTSLYAVTVALGYISGPLIARLCSGYFPLTLAFFVSGVLASSAAAYAALALEPDARSAGTDVDESGGEPAERLSALALVLRIKNSCFATFAYGYFQASVVLFLPLFLKEEKGIAPEQTIVIPAFFAGGMLLFSNLAGRVGDRVGHLGVMRLLACVGTAMILGFVFLDTYALMCAAVFVAGASLASISPLSLALQGVVTSEFSRATAIYNAFYAAGMLLGPPVSSRLFEAGGGALMLYHLAAIWAAFVVFSLVFYRDDPAVRRNAQSLSSVPS